jgi:hypothetical protein
LVQVFANRRFCKLRLALLSLLFFTRHGHACDEPVSRCATLETVLPPVTSSDFIGLHSRAPNETTPRLALDTQYQHRPLVVVAASPDPFGREIPILSDWGVVTLSGDTPIGKRARLGGALPASLVFSGTGLSGLTSTQGTAPDALSFGDPELHGSFAFELGDVRGLVVQRLRLPLGAAESFISHKGLQYAPSMAFALDLGDTTLATEFGVRLRNAQRLLDVTIGSEASVALGVSQRLWRSLLASVEALVLPSLTRDEQAIGQGFSRYRRTPASWLASISVATDEHRVNLGAGSSIALSRRETASEVTTVSGPPGEVLRLALRWERSF